MDTWNEAQVGRPGWQEALQNFFDLALLTEPDSIEIEKSWVETSDGYVHYTFSFNVHHTKVSFNIHRTPPSREKVEYTIVFEGTTHTVPTAAAAVEWVKSIISSPKPVRSAFTVDSTLARIARLML